VTGTTIRQVPSTPPKFAGIAPLDSAISCEPGRADNVPGPAAVVLPFGSVQV